MPGFRQVLKYGYSNARVKAMESRLIGKDAIERMAKSKGIDELIAMLYETEYKKSMIEFGGMSIKEAMLDAAISKNMAENVAKLVAITPKDEKELVRAVVSEWDFYNIVLLAEALDRKMRFEAIESKIIDYGPFNKQAIREAMKKESIESALAYLASIAPFTYRHAISQGIEAYKREKSTLALLNELEHERYLMLASAVKKIRNIDWSVAKVLRLDIDMHNIVEILIGRSEGIEFEKLKGQLVEGGMLDMKRLSDAYNASSIEEMFKNIREFDISKSLALYEKDHRLVHIEIGMAQHIQAMSAKLLRHRVLSFATIIAYVYLKKSEITKLKVIAGSKRYPLTAEEVEEMIA